MKYLLRSVQKLCPPNTRFFADYSSNITGTANAISYYAYSILSSLSLQLYSLIQMIHSWFYFLICI
jgi:hypothetical protein